MKHRTGLHCGKVATLAAVTVVAFTMLTGVAFAVDPSDGTDSTATLTGAALSIPSGVADGTFAATLDGTAKVLDGSGFTGFSIDDARGTGVGWSVTMQATQFDNATAAGKDLALNSLTAPLFGVAKGDAGSSAVPGTLHAAATIDTGASGVVMAACSANGQGMGSYNFSALATAWKLALTADEYVGIYNSTVTTTLSPLTLE